MLLQITDEKYNKIYSAELRLLLPNLSRSQPALPEAPKSVRLLFK